MSPWPRTARAWRALPANAEKLIDGDRGNSGGDGRPPPTVPVPCEWTVTFDKVYQLQQIRFHFYDGDARFYHYTMAVSTDGVSYKPLIDRNQGQSFRWQVIPLKGQPVKSIKLFGTFSYKKQSFLRHRIRSLLHPSQAISRVGYAHHDRRENFLPSYHALVGAAHPTRAESSPRGRVPADIIPPRKSPTRKRLFLRLTARGSTAGL